MIADELARFLKRSLRIEAMCDVVDPTLHRSREALRS
jgi:hypothetical protein